MDGEKCHRKTHEKYEKPVRFLTMPLYLCVKKFIIIKHTTTQTNKNKFTHNLLFCDLYNLFVSILKKK